MNTTRVLVSDAFIENFNNRDLVQHEEFYPIGNGVYF